MNTTALLERFSLDGRVALITGASGGIGSALARGLAEAGAHVAISGRDVGKLHTLADEITRSNGTASCFPSDMGEPDAPARLAGDVLTHYKRVDILVNCVGMNRRMPIGEVTAAVYDTIMTTNLRSVFFLTQAIAPHIAANGGGKIINIGSLTSSLALQHVSIYGMSKSALAQLTKTMAVEWALANIQVNCLCPGFIATELTAPLWNDPTRNRWMLDRIPMKRAGQPADLVGMLLVLASSASDYITGQSIYVDGGFTVGSQW